MQPQVFSALLQTSSPRCLNAHWALVGCPIIPRGQQRSQLLVAHLDRLGYERVPHRRLHAVDNLLLKLLVEV
jgi:hypothetical protein